MEQLKEVIDIDSSYATLGLDRSLYTFLEILPSWQTALQRMELSPPFCLVVVGLWPDIFIWSYHYLMELLS